jgi:hypothetical protein
MRRHWVQVVSIAIVAGSLSATSDSNVATAPSGAEIKDNVIVPCLLPARIRKLGGIVYPSRRQLEQTTATKCELKGGEYTTYDRARPEAAVAFFTPLANEGDATAQTKLGEVYEYLFDPPRYEDAVVWYRKAADQNDPTGQRRLAHLYEFGLGAPKDPLVATNLWRKAIGVNEDFVLASTLQSAQTAADQRIAELTAALRARNADADQLARELAASRAKVATDQSALAAAEANVAKLQHELAGANTAGNGVDPEQVRQLEAQIVEQQRKLQEQRYQIQTNEIAMASQQATLEASLKRAALDNQRLEQELAKTNAVNDADLSRSAQQLEQRDDEVAALKQQQQQLQVQLEEQRKKTDGIANELAAVRAGSASTSRDELARAASLEAQRQQQLAELAKSEANAKALKDQLAAAQADASRLRTSLDAAVHQRKHLEAQVTRTEATLAATRIGLDSAQANLESLRNEASAAKAERDRLASQQSGSTQEMKQEIAQRDAQISTLTQQIGAKTAEVSTLQTKVSKLQTELAGMPVRPDPLPDTSHLTLPAGTDLGKQYALVIGNNNYTNLPKLRFARNDAQRVYDELTSHYGFKGTLLFDVTAPEILRTAKELNEKLGPNDSVVIYFAGHGAPSPDGGISYWLGVDARDEPSTYTSYGVSSYTLDDWLEKFAAKHVLVVADSCYSGTGIEAIGGIKLKSADRVKQLEMALGGPSRTVIASGANQPVPDGGAVDGSVFTHTFVGLLGENKGILTDAEMYAHLRERMQFGATRGVISVQSPVFGRIENGGHVRGQFVFLDPRLQS